MSQVIRFLIVGYLLLFPVYGYSAYTTSLPYPTTIEKQRIITDPNAVFRFFEIFYPRIFPNNCCTQSYLYEDYDGEGYYRLYSTGAALLNYYSYSSEQWFMYYSPYYYDEPVQRFASTIDTINIFSDVLQEIWNIQFGSRTTRSNPNSQYWIDDNNVYAQYQYTPYVLTWNYYNGYPSYRYEPYYGGFYNPFFFGYQYY